MGIKLSILEWDIQKKNNFLTKIYKPFKIYIFELLRCDGSWAAINSHFRSIISECYSFVIVFQLDSRVLSTKLQEEVFKYARDNLVKVSVYIKDPYVSKYITEEKITEIAFVGTVGGVLGLFLGFSFVSAVEICYVFRFKYIKQKCC